MKSFAQGNIYSEVDYKNKRWHLRKDEEHNGLISALVQLGKSTEETE